MTSSESSSLKYSQHNSFKDYSCQVDENVVESNDKQTLLDSKEQSVARLLTYRVYKLRWYILFQFGLLSFIQTAIAGMWSPISLSAAKAFNFTKHDFDLLANWGVAGLMIFLPFDIFVLNRCGLRYAVLFGTVCVFVGSGLRCIPLPALQKKYLIHAGQFLNGVGGCPVMSCAPFLSNSWFPFRDRVFATGIMLLSGNMGGILSYLMGPFLVEQPNNTTSANFTDNTDAIRRQIDTYLLIEFGIALLLFILMMSYFPSKPPTPPSLSASTRRFQFLTGIKQLSKNGTYWSIGFIYILMVGGFYGWQGVSPMLYEDKGISQKLIGVISSVTTASGVVVGLIFAWLADRLKIYRSVLWVFCVIVGYLACLYIVAISLNWFNIRPFLLTTGSLWFGLVLSGTLLNAIQPIAMEMWADVAYPIDEGTATSIPVWISMLVMVIYLTSLSRLQDQNIAFYIMIGMMTSALPLLYFSLRKTESRMEVDMPS